MGTPKKTQIENFPIFLNRSYKTFCIFTGLNSSLAQSAGELSWHNSVQKVAHGVFNTFRNWIYQSCQLEFTKTLNHTARIPHHPLHSVLVT